MGKKKKREERKEEEKEKITVKDLIMRFFCPFMFRGDLSIKISLLSHHVFHVLFIPSLVSVGFEELNSFESPRF
jgi:hypothetical protein